MAGTLDLLFVEDGAQSAASVARWLADLLGTAQTSLDLAIYDCHLEGESADLVVGALRERERAGVKLRVLYNAPRPAETAGPGVVPGHPDQTAAFFAAHGIEAHPVGDAQRGAHLMHHKYVVVDAGTPLARIWTGSANLTMAAFTRQENNLLDIASPELAAAYAADFEDLWKTRDISGSGARGGRATVEYAGEPASIEVRFAPGEGVGIDHELARRIRAAQREVTLAALLVSSGHVLGALRDTAARGVAIGGVVDLSQMETLIEHWQKTPESAWKAETFAALAKGGRLHGKHSSRSWPAGPHDYLHDKVMIIDDTVVTGSYNYSGDAESNAENILFIESPKLAAAYRAEVERLTRRYPPIAEGGSAGPPVPPG